MTAVQPRGADFPAAPKDAAVPRSLFHPFETALREFYLAGGSEVSVIRAPAPIFKEFLRGYPRTSVPRYQNVLVELATPQCHVSILGKRAAGQAFESPATPR